MYINHSFYPSYRDIAMFSMNHQQCVHRLILHEPTDTAIRIIDNT